MDSQHPAESPRRTQSPVGFAFWMQRVLAECQRASIDFAPDPVHDLRVALRRCRSMADGLMAIDPDPSWRSMKKAGKRLFASLGELRDTQVMAEWVRKLAPPADPEGAALLQLLAGREQTQKLLAREAVDAFDQRQWRKWSRELPQRSSRIRKGSLPFQHLALERWTEAHELHRQAMRNRSQVAFHQLRIGIKRFRYIVENFLPQQHEAWSADLKELQDLLGDVHDLDVLWLAASQVNAFPNEEANQRWRNVIREAREKRILRYRERMLGPASLWRVWRGELPAGNQLKAAAMARVRVWGSFLDPDFVHSEHVADLASQLFEGLRDARFWPGSADRDLLQILTAAALTHDVGCAKHQKGHHKASYRMIRNLNPPLGWTLPELQLTAVVARFHRGAFPQPRHKLLRELSPEDRKTAIYLASILRLANAFDAGRDQRVKRLQVERTAANLVVFATGLMPWSSSARAVAADRYLLETLLRIPIVVKALKPVRRVLRTVHAAPLPAA